MNGSLTFQSVIEKVIYTPDPINPGLTIANRMAWIDSQIYGFRRAIEAFGLDRFKNNSTKASDGFNYILRMLYPKHVQNLVAESTNNQVVSGVPTFDETKEKFKEKAKEIARQSAEKITLVSNPNVDS